MGSKPGAPPPAAPDAPAKAVASTSTSGGNAGDYKSPRAVIPAAIDLAISSGPEYGAEPILVYGVEGVGKSTLAAFLPSPLFLDVERSTRKLNVSRDMSIRDWQTLRGKVQAFASKPLPGVRTLVLDTATEAERFAKEFVLSNKRAERRNGSTQQVGNIDEFGWGKGWNFVFDEFDALLGDFERVLALGVNVCLISHAAETEKKNPDTDDYQRWEPHLYAGDKRKRASIRDRVCQWAEHVVFVYPDLHVTEAGKAQGGSARSVSTDPVGSRVAKSRTKCLTMSYELSKPGELWRALGIVE